MYIIINKTNNTTSTWEGNYPLHLIENMLEHNEDIIIISSYSNTIKIPNGFEDLNGIREYLWKEYPLPVDLINQTKY
jgi:hypothetical protein